MDLKISLILNYEVSLFGISLVNSISSVQYIMKIFRKIKTKEEDYTHIFGCCFISLVI